MPHGRRTGTLHLKHEPASVSSRRHSDSASKLIVAVCPDILSLGLSMGGRGYKQPRAVESNRTETILIDSQDNPDLILA